MAPAQVAEITPLQTLILWALIARGGQALQKDIKPDLKKADREAMVRLQLLRIDRGPRNSVLCEVLDRGWAWAAANTSAPLPANSSSGSLVLGDLLRRLAGFLAATDTPLAEFIHPPTAAPAPVERRLAMPPALAAPSGFANAIARVRGTYLAATGGSVNRRVRLADIRAALPDLEPAALNAALLAMLAGGGVGLLPIDDPTQITAADRAAQIIVGGRERHLLWLDR